VLKRDALAVYRSGAVTRWHMDPFERMLNTAKNLLPRLQLSIASLQTSPQSKQQDDWSSRDLLSEI
jgi:hypothetical protein